MTSIPPLLTTYASVNLAALAHNLSCIKQYLSPACDVMAIVKANAYGHGAVDSAQEFARLGINRFAVASLDEGIALRQAGISASIVVLGALFEGQVYDLVAHQLTPVISDGRILPALAKAAGSHPLPYPVHLKVETGMGRLGFDTNDLRSLLDDPVLRNPLQVEGLMTHLADADGADVAFTERQLVAFRVMLEQIRRRGFTLPLVHAANSAAIVRFPDAHFSLVRPGIMLYGYHTLPDTVPAPDLKPVLSLRTMIVQLRTIPRGGTVSYNSTFTANRVTRIGVLPIGYADGYSRRLSNRGSVLIRGRRVPIIGTVCMDMIMVDVTDLPQLQVGEPATLIGQQGQESIWADEVAEWIGTIPYEVLCGIGSRVPRLYESV